MAFVLAVGVLFICLSEGIRTSIHYISIHCIFPIWSNKYMCLSVFLQKQIHGFLFHAFHDSQNGLVKIMIHASDSHVPVITGGASRSMQNCKTWVAFGHRAILRYFPCHLIAPCLYDESSRGLLFLHALSGCDTESTLFETCLI